MAKFFEFETPRQLLEKAEHEFQRLIDDVTSDNVFNFFVSAYHIVDRIKEIDSIPPKDIRDLNSNPDFRKCRYICLKSKHLKLNKGDDEFDTHRRPAAIWGDAVWGESMWDTGRAYFIIEKNERVDVLELGQRVINLWESFLNQHHI